MGRFPKHAHAVDMPLYTGLSVATGIGHVQHHTGEDTGSDEMCIRDSYEEVIAEMGFPVLSTRLPDSKKFRRDLSEERKSVFRSTIFPMDTAPVSYTHLWCNSPPTSCPPSAP